MENTFKYLFFGASAIAGVLWFLLDRRGRSLSKVISDTQFQMLEERLKNINEKSNGSENEYIDAKKEYEALKRAHGHLFDSVRDDKGDGTNSN